jgi:hypothetical protein
MAVALALAQIVFPLTRGRQTLVAVVAAAVVTTAQVVEMVVRVSSSCATQIRFHSHPPPPVLQRS